MLSNTHTQTIIPCVLIVHVRHHVSYEITQQKSTDQESWQFLLRTNGAARLWIDDHILVDTSCDAPISKANGSHVSVPPSNCGAWTASSDGAVVSYAGRDNVTHHIHNGLHMRLEWLHYGGGNAVMQLLWRPGTPSTLPSG